MINMKYIDADKLIAEIERYKKGAAIARFDNAGENADYFQGKVDLCDDLTHIIASLQQEQTDYKEAVQLVFEEELTPFKDGNQWCFLLGRNLQDGICGFGDTILDAAVDFYKDYMNTKIHIGELKISMAQQEQSEVDLDKEIIRYQREDMDRDTTVRDVARHFFELGKAKKEE